MRKISKKAEGMSMTGVLIALIILVIAAVVLILAFTGRLGGFWEILGLKSSLSDTTKSCQIACASSDVTGYCVQSRSVKGIPDSITDIGTKKVKNGGVDGVTCMQLEVATGLVCDAQEIKSNVKCGAAPITVACEANRECAKEGKAIGDCETGKLDNTGKVVSAIGKVCCSQACNTAVLP